MAATKIYFLFDVESLGLHGEGFAFGYEVKGQDGRPYAKGQLMSKEGYEKALILASKEAHEWVQKQKEEDGFSFTDMCKGMENIPTVQTTKELRNEFFTIMRTWMERGAEIWSDCNFPVETNFLSAIVADGNGARDWQMPFPLKDLSTIMPVNIDRIKACGFKELKKHNPKDDATASMYCLLFNLHGIDRPYLS